MPKYDVMWNVPVDAESPGGAARIAREIQLDPDSLATVFEVIDEDDQPYTIDVGEGFTPTGKEAEDV